MSRVRTPRLRCVGSTPTAVTPDVGTVASPGTVTSISYAPAVPHSRSPSNAPKNRGHSVVATTCSRSGADNGDENAASSTTRVASRSSGPSTRSERSMASF